MVNQVRDNRGQAASGPIVLFEENFKKLDLKFTAKEQKLTLIKKVEDDTLPQPEIDKTEGRNIKVITFEVVAEVGTNSFTDSTVSAGVTYSYVVSAVDQDDNVSADSSPLSVTANNPPAPDTTPPTATITDPINGQTKSGTVVINASATDDVGVEKVEFYVDSALKSTDTVSSYDYNWDSTTVVDGTHTIYAKAFDTSNNATVSATINITVVNTTTPSKLGDLNGDNQVNIYDLSILLSRWRQSGGNADINKDGRVDIYDLSILLSRWRS